MKIEIKSTIFNSNTVLLNFYTNFFIVLSSYSISLSSEILTNLLFLFCYNSKLGSDYNLDKDLSKSKEDDQLVKCKNIGLWEKHKKVFTTIWDTNW